MKESITMLVEITGHDLKGNRVIDHLLYETIAVPRIGEYIMVYPNSNDNFYYLKVILVIHKGLRKNTKDFYDKEIQVFGIVAEHEDIFKDF
jgi:hypothetical protein